MDENRKNETQLDREAIGERMGRIAHKILVLSGKGGVGKSTVAVNLAISLVMAGKRVGLLDVDIHGPSVPKLLGLEGNRAEVRNNALVPVSIGNDLKVMSIGFALPQSDDAVIWRGPLKMGVIKQFLKDVAWGELDCLVVDSPPGTGDEPLSVCQLIENPDGAVIVTTPQDVAIIDVRKCVNFCRQLKLPVLGVIENMSGFVCPKCGERTEIFKSGGGEHMAKEMNVPFLGRIPIDPGIVEACDSGKPYMRYYADTETAGIMRNIIRPILGGMDEALEVEEVSKAALNNAKDGTKGKEKDMRIAIPIVEGKLAMHFGHCQHFAMIDVDTEKKEIEQTELVDAPNHQPGLLPVWLAERGANMIIAGGMGMRAQQLFTQQNIQVLIGAPSEDPDTIARAYLDGTLQTGDNICDH